MGLHVASYRPICLQRIIGVSPSMAMEMAMVVASASTMMVRSYVCPTGLGEGPCTVKCTLVVYLERKGWQVSGIACLVLVRACGLSVGIPPV